MSEPHRESAELAALLTDLSADFRDALPPEVRLRRRVGAQGLRVAPSAAELRPLLATLWEFAVGQTLPAGGEVEVSLSYVDFRKPQIAERRGVSIGAHLRLSFRAVPAEPEGDDLLLVCAEPSSLDEPGLEALDAKLRPFGGSLRVDAIGDTVLVVHAHLPVVRGEAPTSPPVGSGTILFVDDEPAILAVHRQTMESMGFEVLDCRDAQMALRIGLAAGDRIDILFSDQSMPELSGMELARQLHERWPELPVILSTGFSAEADASEPATWIRAVLNKPFSMEELSSVLAALQSNHAQDAHD